MKTGSIILILFCILSLTVLSQQALAHNLWLNPADYYPQVGTTVEIGIGWGHTYPANRVDQEVAEDRVEEIRAIDPDGLKASFQNAKLLQGRKGRGLSYSSQDQTGLFYPDVRRQTMGLDV